MIRKLCFMLFIALLALLAIGLFKKHKKRTAEAVQVIAEETTPLKALAGNALRVRYSFWPPYAAENPVTNRNGYCLDVLRRIFPQATFIRDDRELPEAVPVLSEDPAAAFVIFGKHPLLKDFPQSTEVFGFYNVVIFSPRQKAWRYAGPDSLETICLGYGADYLEVPLVADLSAKYQNDPTRIKCFPFGSKMNVWMALAEKGEVDAFIATEATGEWDDAHSNLVLRDAFRASEPIARMPLYLTLSGLDPAYAARVLQEFDDGIRRLEREGVLTRLRQHYGLPEHKVVSKTR